MMRSYFWRCLRCRLLHFDDDEPRFCEHCDSTEFAMVLLGRDEDRSAERTLQPVA
ncbi:MAG: hypothetical protein HY331_09600 [Chloroflexi bacterium]|nr:hypothetical protein [Chloroflexota bacterium]